MSRAFLQLLNLVPSQTPQALPFSQSWEDRLPWPCPHREQLSWLDTLVEISWWELHICMKIRDKLEAKVLA